MLFEVYGELRRGLSDYKVVRSVVRDEYCIYMKFRFYVMFVYWCGEDDE